MNRLRTERQRRGWSQARLARTLHIDHSSVSHYETGFSRPRRATAAALADIFGIPAEELLAMNDKAAASLKTAASNPQDRTSLGVPNDGE